MKSVIRLVLILNLAYFMVEFAMARAIGSVSLFADSIDFLEDGMVNLLILIALDWSRPRRAGVGMALALILLVPGLATLWTAWNQFHLHLPPRPIPLSLTGGGALLVNFSCALMLSRYRKHAGSLTKAAFLSARNDVFANIAIIAAGIVTSIHPSIWPDMAVGLGIAVMNADAAKEVWSAARAERHSDS
ncbi:MAG: cation transporter [Fibrobacteria bacterium]